MKRNMKQWVQEVLDAPVKRAMPVLSFPAIQLMDITVRDLISSSDLQSKGMKMVADRVPAAAAVSLMDLSVEAECFGSQIRFSDDEVPTVVGALVSSAEEVDALKVPAVGAGRTGIYIESIEKAMKLIEDRPVFAGVIGPFSLAGRLMDVTEAMIYCYEEPEMVSALMDKVTEFLIAYCSAYKQVGANGVVLAEPLAGLLSPALAEEFSAPYVKKIVEAVQSDDFLVVYHNCGNAAIQMIDSILDTGAAMFHFGNAISMKEMLEHIPADKIAMGNVDPARQLRNGTPASVREETLRIMGECCNHPNFVISTGCDVPPMSPWANIVAFFQAVDEFYKNK